ncbi:MAG: sialidase family protein, partial [Chitinophagales bacterium]
MYKLKFSFAIIVAVFLFQSFVLQSPGYRAEQPMASIRGVSPSLAVDHNNLLMAYASGDTIFFCMSSDHGKAFSAPTRVAILTGLSVGGGRGPQVVATKDQLVIAATDKAGNIYSFIKNKTAQRWEKTGRINDVPDIAKEGFVSLAAGHENEVYAVWLDLRNNKKNKVAGARSLDGGKTWSTNKIIYTSPGGTVCECCKPSVEMKN